jgi:p-aminobenzoyl-glutamate transporter AbgT
VSANQSPPPASTLAIIRIALLMGVLIFGAVTYSLQRGADWRAFEPDALATLRLFVLSAWAAAALVLIILRVRLGGLTQSAGRSMLIVAWAIGEGAALVGGVYYFLSGESQWFVIGLFLMLTSFILFPIRRT